MGSRAGHVRGGHRTALVLAAVAMVLAMVPTGAVAQETDPRQGLEPGTDVTSGGNAYTVPNADAETAALNMQLLANRPKPAWNTAAAAFNYSNIGSDLAFTGDYAISGNYLGFGIYDISDPNDPVLRTTVNCPGGQGDVSVYGDLLFMSVESKRSTTACDSTTLSNGWSGIRIFDISDIENPQYVEAVTTCRGSHTHTVVEDLDDEDNVYVYVSGTAAVRNVTATSSDQVRQWAEGCAVGPSSTSNPSLYLDADGNPVPTSRFQVEVIKVPLASPTDAAIVKEARLMQNYDTGNPHGLWTGGNHGPGTQSTSATHACHDLTSYPELELIAGACYGNGLLIDVSDPENPIRIEEVTDPNFAFWHSATFNNDGTKVVFTDEWGGGVGARCRTTDPDNWGANAIFDIVRDEDGPRLEFASYYKIPNVQATNETCVAHNGSLIPVPGRDVMVQAWYEGGVSVFDFTDSANPTEIAFFDRGPYAPLPTFHQGGYWSAYWYNGRAYGNEIFLGFDSFGLQSSDALSDNELAATTAVTMGEFNAQAQRRIEWAPTFTLSRAYLDQVVRNDQIDAEKAADVARFLDRAERFGSGPQRQAAVATLRGIAGELTQPEQQLLADSLRSLADTL